MADVSLLKERSLASIDAANTILQNYPDFKSTNTDRSLTLFSTSTDPLSFIIDIVKHTEGYDALLDIISKFLVFGIEPLEIGVKTAIITHLKNYLSCSINPYITEDLLREGIAFNLSSTDLTNMFEMCPLDPYGGKHYYFGIENNDKITITDELNKARDFNALLWFMRNRSVGRQVWYGSKNQETNANIENPEQGKPHEKNDGIITLEYGEFFQIMSDAQGGACCTQLPTRDCIHIFLGNTAHCGSPFASEIALIDDEIKSHQNEWDRIQEEIDSYNEQLIQLDDYVGFIGDKEYNSQYITIKNELERLNNLRDKVENDLEDCQIRRNEAEENYLSSPKTYPYIEDNYYYGKTLMKFNTDLVMSMDIFDSKVLVAQILENLTGNISISLGLNYSRRIIQEEVLRMVKSVIESDDAVVSDCFFSFSNDDYDAMLRKTDLERAGVYSNEGFPVSDAVLDSESLLAMLNEINPDSSEEEQISIYTRFFNNISESIATSGGGVSQEFSLSLKMNLLEELLTQLATAICISVISPKLYIILAINLKIMGRSVNFSLRDFIQMYRQMLVDLIRTIRDMILRFFITHIRRILLELAKRVSVDLIREQADFYFGLLQQCVGCYNLFKFGRQANDWEMGMVTADIINEENDSPKNAEC